MFNKVTINFMGTDYFFATDEPVEYAESLGAEMDARLREIRKKSPSASITQSAVLLALEYLDAAKKLQKENEAQRSQLKNYHNIVLKNNEKNEKNSEKNEKNEKKDAAQD